MGPPAPRPRPDAAAPAPAGADTYRDLADYTLAALAGLAPPDGLRGRLARARPAFLDLLRVPVSFSRAASSGEKNTATHASPSIFFFSCVPAPRPPARISLWSLQLPGRCSAQHQA